MSDQLERLIQQERQRLIIGSVLLVMVSLLLGIALVNKGDVLTNRKVSLDNQATFKTLLCTTSIPIQEKSQIEINKCYVSPYARPGQPEVK